MNKDITIVLTSCGRYKLLKKTITSLGKNIDINQYEKIMTEDSKNDNHIKKIKYENENGFLKGWKILYTKGSGHKETFNSHLSALKILYDNIETNYTFHLEDDWYFQKVNFNFLELSKNILETHPDIGIVLIIDYEKDGGLSSGNHTKKERFDELFIDKTLEFNGKNFRYLNKNDRTHGFTLNPGLRRTSQVKELMFRENEVKINEDIIGERYSEIGLNSINLEPGIVLHTGYGIHTTGFNNLFNDGIFIGVKNIFTNVLYNSFKYRFKLLLRYIGIEKMINNQNFYLFIMESPLGYIIDYFLGLYRKKRVKDVDESITNNIEGIKELNIPLSWFTENKPLGISGVARLKNSDDFLEKIIESYIPYLDEIILVNNLSTDKTEEICKRLIKKYPEKIKYFEYKYALGGYVGDKDYPTNSIYSLAYYYNWCFSKSKYKYVMKLDDDNLPIIEKWEKIRKYIIKKQPNKFCIYWGYNILKNGENFGFFKKEMFSGSGGDHGIYPVSKKTYYLQGGLYENFIFGIQYKRFGLSFLHLKYIKEKKGQVNLNSRMKHLFLGDEFLNNNFIKINDKKILNNLNNFLK